MAYVPVDGHLCALAEVHVTDGQCSPVVCQHYYPGCTTMDMGLLRADQCRCCKCTTEQAEHVYRRGRLANGRSAIFWWCPLALIHGCTHRLPRTRVMQTTELRTPANKTFRPSSTTSCVNRTSRESSISSSSSSTRSGRTTRSVVSRDTGVYSTRSVYLAHSFRHEH